MFRSIGRADSVLAALDAGLRSLLAAPAPSRPSPAAALEEPALGHAERRRSAALMRVNHAGELAAQALYHGQAVTARHAATRRRLLAAADEERDHLAWCADRLAELGARPSRLGPFWFAGSAALGVLAGGRGDAASLGFVAETERQVEAHLDDHLRRLPAADRTSRAILAQMSADERRHGELAQAAGGTPLPALQKSLMRIGGEILRQTASIL